MTSEMNLSEALESAASHAIKERTVGLINLRQILKHNLGTSKIDNLKDPALSKIFDTLFGVVTLEFSIIAQIQAGQSKKTTVPATRTRLSSCAATFLVAVDVSVRNLRYKSVKAIVEHIINYSAESDGRPCLELASDYAKSLSVVLAHEPHVEHLSQDIWKQAVAFCIGTIRSACKVEGDLGSSILSARSSRSHFAPSQASNKTSLPRQAVDDLVSALRSLTSVSFAPLVGQGPQIITAMAQFVSTSPRMGKPQVDALVTINNILLQVRTENVKFTRSFARDSLALAKSLWSTKLPALKDEVLIMLVLLHPYIDVLSQDQEDDMFSIDIVNFVETLKGEYVKRAVKDQLQLNHLTLRLSQVNPKDGLQGQIFALRDGLVVSENNLSPEHNWTLVKFMALFAIQSHSRDTGIARRSESPGDSGPKKRQRVTQWSDDFLRMLSDFNVTTRICSLQMISFAAQTVVIEEEILGNLVEKLAACITDDNSVVVSWAHLALASCASQASSRVEALTNTWNSIWRFTLRAVNPSSTCRTACHLLHAMMQTELMDRSTVLENVGTMLSTVAVSGPTVCCDSVTALLKTVMIELQRESTSLFVERAGQILSWLYRTWAPSNFHDKIFAFQNINIDLIGILNLINTCLGLPTEKQPPQELPIWGAVGQSWILHEQSRELLDYLLLKTKRTLAVSQFGRFEESPSASSPLNNASATLTLGLCTTETKGAVDKWQGLREQGGGNLDKHMIRMVGTLGILGLCLSNCLPTKDLHRTDELRSANEKLLDLMFRDLASPACEQSKVDTLLDLIAHSLFTHHSDIPKDEGQGPHICMSRLSPRLLELLEKRRELTQPESLAQKNDMSDLDFDTDFDSQVTSLSVPTLELRPPRKAISNNYSASAQRTGITIYAKLMQSIHSPDGDDGTNVNQAETFVAGVLELPTLDILASGPMLTVLPRYGMQLTAKQFEPLLEFFADQTLQSYEYERAEVNMDLLLRVMDSFVDTWTDPSERDLYTTGLDIYKWFTITAMKAKLLSFCVQKRLVQVMLQVLQIDAEYGQTDNLQPVRSMLFRVMGEGTLDVKYFIAQRIAPIFNLFSLPMHVEIMEELRSSLPTDLECVEGLAVTILVLAKLAASWHSLRMRCIYHIFETAGMTSDVKSYAAVCVATISDALKLKSPRQIFRLFSPQLLYTWLGKHDIAKVPHNVFGYDNMAELLEDNLDEVYSQLVIRDKDDGIRWLVKTLDSTEEKILRATFSKSVAYAISWDVCVKQGSPSDSSQVTTACESRLRAFFKTSGEYYMMVHTHLPDIIAQIFTSANHEEAVERALGKKPQYAYAKDALSAMKQYGFLDQELAQAQEPNFKGRYLVDQLERVCRRTGNKTFTIISDVLDVPHISATLRSIIDSMHPAYGPLHACQSVRKLRIFIAVAGGEVFSGYPLQILIRTMQSIIVDPHCSDDGMGVLRYILERGRDFLGEEIPMVTGTALLILLSLKQFMISRQDKTTQESQFRNTVSKMQSFHDWLVEYLLQFQSVFKKERQRTSFTSLVQACRQLELPASAEMNEAASSMLKGLLDDEKSDLPILGPIERKQVISTLCRHFRVRDKTSEDLFGSDGLSVSYARRVWASTQTLTAAEDYRAWAARVLGRAYASTVSLEQIRPTQGLISHLIDGFGDKDQSVRAVVTKLNNLLSSDVASHIGVAEQSLRKMSYRFQELKNAQGSVDFDQMLPFHISTAVSRAYTKDIVESNASQKFRQKDLWHAATLDRSTSFEPWIQNLAVAICRWVKDDPIVGPLENLFVTADGFAQDLFPYILHLALSSEVEKEQVVRTYLSESFTTHFSDHGADTDRKSRLLLETLLYLLTQHLPGERTRMGRLEWLDLDYFIAAEAAAKCNMPTAALYLGEMGVVPEVDPRPSRRSSVNSAPDKTLSSELLLSIFTRVDDPDSFYGVEQPPSLESVLARVHHEGDGLKGMMLHSARMDASLRKSGRPEESDSFGMIRSMGTMNLSSLTHDLLNRREGNQSTASTTDTMLEAARKLEQWDISPPQLNDSAASTLYSMFRGLSAATSLDTVQVQLNESLGLSIKRLQDPRLDASALRSTLSGIAVLNEIDELTMVRCASDLSGLWNRMQSRQNGWDIGRFNDAQQIVSCRETLFSLLSQNKNLREALHLSIRDCRVIETRSVISSSQFARRNDLIQQSLTAATYLSQLVPICQEIDVKMDAAAQFEVASTLWRQGEISTSVQMLQELCSRTDLLKQSVQIGRAGMLAQLGHEIAEARLEKPEEVITNYLKPAIVQLDQATSGSEAGKVFHEFASFCDRQLQDPGNMEDFQRLSKLRERKLGELKQYETLVKATTDKERKRDLLKQHRVVHSWYTLDNDEFQKVLRGRDDFVRQSLQNYLQALEVSDEFNASVVRFFALWLEHADSESANEVVLKYLPKVPSWKFVGLMNQQTSRLQYDTSLFQRSLRELITRICVEHPYHGIHYVFTAAAPEVEEKPQQDKTQPAASDSRRNAASFIASHLEKDKRVGDITRRSFAVSQAYHNLAMKKIKSSNRITLDMVPAAKAMADAAARNRVPPATMSVELRPSANYSDVPVVVRYRSEIKIAGGLSAPKILVAVGTDGRFYRQLFKGGNDDLRQDAIMEQVFGEVSKMLQHHKSSRQRNLHIRTYKVLPLTSSSGIIEFVPHSIPLGEFLVPAHHKYHPTDLKQGPAREKIGNVQTQSRDVRLKAYREVAAKHQPVLRHFFFERFQDPDDWFQKRLNYTRSTATISILGWILGLGDRHCHNILLDEQSGEAIHIDLGVAFEAGRVLPIPEVVPFRLTRDIVDGMGVTKTEGVFRRCCEFSIDALRAEKDAIMTLLNVLRYDPLYSWTVSPLKARRMQDPRQEAEAGATGFSSRRPEDEAGEAARALAIVEKKLSKTLSGAATVNELIQQASDERNLAVLFAGWAAYA